MRAYLEAVQLLAWQREVLHQLRDRREELSEIRGAFVMVGDRLLECVEAFPEIALQESDYELLKELNEEFLRELNPMTPAQVETAEVARAAGLSDAEVLALEGADHVGLVMAARSFRAKRQRRRNRRALSWLFSGRNR